ncbi:NAD(P)-dependent oxidoreductase [Microlunatus endophyticus]|uniref:NAD(P)-dependent oxidoreductase n=1 Tax=Microlunatus endophyticus TaxID=1716077 RepID=A0A917SCC2_9ACTN|nr:SDR family oxidoreductase [Microlunatus endophyticus]GGL71692.1 NAD(P)-dependent oxidoreductase [Microlunatus endophyticus]
MTRRLTLITGGTRGIGAATAELLARIGHDLVLGYRNDDQAAESTAETVRSLGARCTLVRADVADPDGIDELFAAATQAGTPTAVINNAGSTRKLAPLAETPVELITDSIQVNLTAAILVARAAVRTLGRSYGGSGGVIINVSSAAATLGSPGEYVYYAAAKAGLDALTLGLGKEVAGQGVRVVGVAPGLVRTEIHASAGEPGRIDRIAPSIPMQRAGEPDEVAQAIAWLISDAASYVTGTTLRVSGGR